MIDTKKVMVYCLEKLRLDQLAIGDEFNYASMPLCVIDSVYSIGVKYEGVKNVIRRFCKHFELPIYAEGEGVPAIQDQRSTSQFLELLCDIPYDELAMQVFRNRQRTSTKNGILKAEAVVRFLQVLKKFEVEYFQDIDKVIADEYFEFQIKKIPGQSSGIALKYFFMLAGRDEFIKPDRMILRFLENITGKKHTLTECQSILAEVTDELKVSGYSLSPKMLDNIIWNYQRQLSNKKAKD